LKKNYPSLARREFLTTAAGVGDAMPAGPWLNAEADGVDPRVAQVISRTIGIDVHDHVYPAGTEPHPHDQPPRPEEQPQAPMGCRRHAMLHFHPQNRTSLGFIRDLLFDFEKKESCTCLTYSRNSKRVSMRALS
jgi:hypothetical protein